MLVKEYQLDPVSHAMLHVDFYRVAMDKAVRVTVPVVARGEPKGVKQQGGVLDIVHRLVELECLPADIPEHIEIDVSEMMIGDSVRVRDVVTNAKWTPISDPETMLLHVIIPRVEEVAPVADAAAAPVAPAEPGSSRRARRKTAEAEEKDKIGPRDRVEIAIWIRIQTRIRRVKWWARNPGHDTPTPGTISGSWLPSVARRHQVVSGGARRGATAIRGWAGVLIAEPTTF